MTHVTCRLTAKNRDQFRNPTLGNRVWDYGQPFLPQASAFLCYALRCEYCMYTHARSITLSEAADILETQLGYDRAKAEHFVKQFDRNNDGRLCATELDNFKTTVRDT